MAQHRLPACARRRFKTRTIVAIATALALAATGFATTAAAPPASLGHMTQVVVQQRDAGGSAAAAIAAAGGHVTRALPIIDGFAASVPASTLAALETSPAVRGVTADSPLSLDSIGSYDPTSDTGSLYDTTLMTGAQAAWKAGYTGKGVDIALIDSGVAPVSGLTTAGKVINGADLSFESQAPNLRYLDTYGHGTHMAGIITAKDAGATAPYAGDTQHVIGMAPDSRLVNVKVADAHGAVDVSQVIAGIDWVVQHRTDNGMNIRVLNLSFGSDSVQAYALDPLSHAVEVAWRSGIVVVAATGNAGWKLTGVDDPASDPFVIAAGAADTHGTNTYGDDTVATFSGQGDLVRNPDLVAPGVHIASLRDPGSYIDMTYGSTGDVAGTTRLFRGSGTSQATAVMSGAAALLIQEHPTINPDQLKKLLTSTATPLSGQSVQAQGAGEVNLNKAIGAPVPLALLATQAWVPSTGLGSLEASRGSVHVSMGGVTLQGEKDIFGNSVSTTTLANLLNAGTAWVGGLFCGVLYTGSGWTGMTWSGESWATAQWTGMTWSGSTWSGITWSGMTWSGSTWSGSTWSSNNWTGSTWSGNTWASAGWK